MTTRLPAPVHLRSYRLTDLGGNPHPVLDDVYESFEAAWQDALEWWERMGHNPNELVAIGVDVSSANGNWRTLQYPCHNRLHTYHFAGRNFTKFWSKSNP
jgi:hypothetical protein